MASRGDCYLVGQWFEVPPGSQRLEKGRLQAAYLVCASPKAHGSNQRGKDYGTRLGFTVYKMVASQSSERPSWKRAANRSGF